MSDRLSNRILVVDDDPAVIAAYRVALASEGNRFSSRFDDLASELFPSGPSLDIAETWRVSFCDQGIAAVREVYWAVDAGDPFAAVFLDVRMPPGIDGFEAARQIRKIDENTHIVVITAYSDYSGDDFIEIAGPRNKFSMLTKPVWPNELRDVASSITSRKL